MNQREAYIRHIKRFWQAGVNAVSARACFERNRSTLDWKEVDQSKHVYVFGAGKAALAMAGELELRFPDKKIKGAVIVPHEYPKSIPEGVNVPSQIDVLTGGHPFPDSRSISSTVRILSELRSIDPETPIFFLLSGGGSALFEYPENGVSLEDLRTVTRLLLESGVSIDKINLVRKQLSSVKGGKLARQLQNRKVRVLVISDVMGNHLETVASGPLLPGFSSWDRFQEIVTTAGIAESLPFSINERLKRGLRSQPGKVKRQNAADETRFEHFIIGDLEQAAKGVLDAALHAGYESYIGNLKVGTGHPEASENGRILAAETTTISSDDTTCIVWGGETTVNVRGSGRGGRNQELALAAGMFLSKHESDTVFLSAGTDGIDGPTNAAGAWTDRTQILEMTTKGYNPEDALKKNDSWQFFDLAGGHVISGPTHTNVMDLQIAIIPPTI